MRAVISRIIAGPVAAFVGWLVSLGLELSAGFTTALTDVTAELIFAAMLVAYGVVHKLLDGRLGGINPADVADTSEPSGW